MFKWFRSGKGRIESILGKFDSMISELEIGVAKLIEKKTKNVEKIAKLETGNKDIDGCIEKARRTRDKLAELLG